MKSTEYLNKKITNYHFFLFFFLCLLVGCASMEAGSLRQKGKIVDWDNEPDKALNYYLESLKLEPDNSNALQAIGRLYYFKGRQDWKEEYFNLAKKYLRKAIDVNNKNATTWNYLGWVYLCTDKFPKMRESFDLAIKNRNHKASWDHVGLGIAYYNLEEYNLAQFNLNKALKLKNFKGSHFEAAIMLANTNNRLGNTNKAETFFQKAKTLANTKKEKGYLTRELIKNAVSMGNYVLAKKLYIERPFIGLTFKRYKEKREISVAKVEEGLFAHFSKIKPNDIITHINGKKVSNFKVVVNAVQSTDYGKSLDFKVLRGGQEVTIKMVLDFNYYLSQKKSLISKTKIASKSSDLSEKNDFGKFHALLIGNNNYQYLTKLKTAINDVKAVASVTKNLYGFKTRVILNGTRRDILTALDKLRNDLTTNDNLLIYYAGHGYFDKDAERGYWLPIDARDDMSADWISNADITDKLKAIRAKHVMVVADSCYSGTLTRNIKIKLRSSDYLIRISKKRARIVLTSGGLEPVMDSGGGNHSVFAKAFIEALKENTEIMDGIQLFSKIRRPVMLNAPQTPQYADIRFAGHEGGDFIFMRIR